MAVAKHNSRATTMPNHMAQPAIGWPYCHCCAKVSQRNAPGAISAMAFIVRPVSPKVFFIWGCCGSEDIRHLVFVRASGRGPGGDRPRPIARGGAIR